MSENQAALNNVSFDALPFLPKSLHSSMLCAILICSDDVDIASCHSNGYLYELKNKNILGSIYVHENEITNLSVTYLYENNLKVKYYTISTGDRKLVIVKRLGFPQIEIKFLESFSDDIFNFADERISENYFDRKCLKNTKDSIEAIISTKESLQMVYMSIEELFTEFIQLSEICNNTSKSYLDSFKISINVDKTIFRLCNNSKPEIEAVYYQYKSFGKFWIFKTRIVNLSDRSLANFHLVIRHEKLIKYNYCFFEMPDIAKWPSQVHNIINPNEELLIVGVAQFSEFDVESKISVECLLSYSNGDKLSLCKHDIEILCAFNENKSIFEGSFLQKVLHN
ncbi:hypothetical protein Phum_PHUM387130 [Pediculus humanus corporis]|uniref:Uncharacterized protein n=1 Tax=Pediculus humanus subsp. corporis TaxID=121224 RepID=E0VQU3_PEDHC|nr:uncharacterized protein Phum_PHUM387130 [Pediculus humanus corporis]EEB15749.1 hypothetical protein Phum_PHUM387130 [Pediculus humanus corporis]